MLYSGFFFFFIIFLLKLPGFCAMINHGAVALENLKFILMPQPHVKE